MKQPKRKRTAAEKAAKKRRRLGFKTIFIGGKQKRVRRPTTIEGMDVDEFLRRNADPIWLFQHEMWVDLGGDLADAGSEIQLAPASVLGWNPE